MEDELLTQEDELEEDINKLEEIKEEKVEQPKQTKGVKEVQSEVPTETYEAFALPARLGIVNTVSEEVIEGFETGKDEGIVQLGKVILNKLDKIAIASGA